MTLPAEIALVGTIAFFIIAIKLCIDVSHELRAARDRLDRLNRIKIKEEGVISYEEWKRRFKERA